MKKTILLAIIAIIVTGCPWSYGYKYDTGSFPDYPVNIVDVNSPYDDYNSTAPFIYYRHLFHYSSNWKSEGGEFDIIGENMFIDWSKTEGTLNISVDDEDDHFEYLIPMFDSINTPFNEFGPYSIGFRREVSYSEVLWTDILMYASDSTGNFDIRFIYGELRNTFDTSTTQIFPHSEISFLNTAANELYPTFFGEGFFYFDEWGQDETLIEKILYCSDEEGDDYDIYEVTLPDGPTLIDKLQSDSPQPPSSVTVNSMANDKCPFVNGNLLVFASDREGGFGGYDLYYSRFSEGTWSDPVNFGEGINSEHDEYRPITMRYFDFDNRLMIFSSDRLGGQGGFDLYYVGIKQSVE